MVFLHYAHTVIAPGVSPLYCYENRTINTVPLLHYSTHCWFVCTAGVPNRCCQMKTARRTNTRKSACTFRGEQVSKMMRRFNAPALQLVGCVPSLKMSAAWAHRTSSPAATHRPPVRPPLPIRALTTFPACAQINQAVYRVLAPARASVRLRSAREKGVHARATYVCCELREVYRVCDTDLY